MADLILPSRSCSWKADFQIYKCTKGRRLFEFFLNSDIRRLGSTWFDIVRDPARGQEEQCHQPTTTDLRIVMGPCAWARPSGALPFAHAFQLGSLVNLDNAVDLAVWMSVILSGVYLLRLHPHGRDAEELGALGGIEHSGASVGLAVQLAVCYPPFIEALTDVGAEVLVVGIAGPVMLVEMIFEQLAWCPG